MAGTDFVELRIAITDGTGRQVQHPALINTNRVQEILFGTPTHTLVYTTGATREVFGDWTTLRRALGLPT